MNFLLQTRQVLPSRFLLFSLFCLSTAITLNTSTSLVTANLPASKAILNKWQFNPKSQQLEITLSANTKPEYFYLDQPPRLVVDLPNTQLGNVNTQQTYSGTIQKIRVSQYSPYITRLVIEMKQGTVVDVNKVKLQPLSSKKPTRWVLHTIFPNGNTTTKNPQNSQSAQNQLSSMTLPPPVINLPINQQPLVTVPPLNPEKPPASSNFTIIPSNYSNSTPNSTIIRTTDVPMIEFGQPLPINNNR